MKSELAQLATILASIIFGIKAGVLWYQGLDWFPMFVFSLVMSLSARVIELERKAAKE